MVATNLENFTFDSPLVLVVDHRKDTLCQGCATTPIQRNGEAREPSRIIGLDQRVMMNFIKIRVLDPILIAWSPSPHRCPPQGWV